MLEESCNTMDKKNNRHSPSFQKPSGTESKRNANGESAVARQFGRGGRRKELPAGKYQPENSPRRPYPQRNKVVFDKRPRSRGNGQPYSNDHRSREDLTDEFTPDYDLAPGRKTNLNHLLNFTYRGHETSRGQSLRYNDGYSRRRWTPKTGKRVSYNKEQYLQANCQFVVKDTGDYSIHNVDPDVLVDWDAIELVNVFSHEIASCPICLEQPSAAKMTRCGHIYCWPCILHYLALGEQTWRKCPICYEAIHEKDLKSVVTKEMPTYKIGQNITMQLMRKERGSTYALPKCMWENADSHIDSMNGDPKKLPYLKMLTATKEDIINNIILKERDILELKSKTAEPSEVAFIDSALHQLKARETNLMKRRSKSDQEVDSRLSSGSDDAKICEPQEPAVEIALPTAQNIKEYSSAFSDEEFEPESSVDDGNAETEGPTLITQQSDLLTEQKSNRNLEMIPDQAASKESDTLPVPDNVPPSLTDQTMAPEDALPVEEAEEQLQIPHVDVDSNKQLNHDAFYFYQAADGQQIFLHAVNARCLVKEYGGLEHSPQTINAKIVEMENVFMTQELRKRLRYLSHLPLTSEFQVAELDLKPPTVSRDTLKCFADDIELRKRLRQKKSRQEKRWSKKVQDDEKRKLGISPGMRIVKSAFTPHVMSENRPVSPAAKSDDSEQSLSSVSSPVGSLQDFVPLGSSLEDEGQQTSMSFAQMLRGGAKKTPVWPKVAENKAETTRQVSKDSDGSDEERIPVPVYRNSFGEAIQTALENHEKGKGNEAEGTGFKMEKLPGKKKKKQQKLLFATSMARGGK